MASSTWSVDSYRHHLSLLTIVLSYCLVGYCSEHEREESVHRLNEGLSDEPVTAFFKAPLSPLVKGTISRFEDWGGKQSLQ